MKTKAIYNFVILFLNIILTPLPCMTMSPESTFGRAKTPENQRTHSCLRGSAERSTEKKRLSWNEQCLAALKDSPSKDKSQFVNFYKKCIQELSHGRISQFADLLNEYFEQIPHNLIIKNITFHQALLHSLASLLAQPISKDNGDGYSIGRPRSLDENNTSLAYLFFKTVEQKMFAMEFRAYNSAKPEEDPYKKVQFVTCGTTEERIIPIIKVWIDIADKPSISVHMRKHSTSNDVKYILEDTDFIEPTYCATNPLRTILSVIEDLNRKNSCRPEEEARRTIRRALNELYALIPSELIIQREKFYQSIFYCMLKFTRCGSIAQELQSLKGRSDIVVQTPTNACVIEFKHKGNAHEAVQQIIDKNYCATEIYKGKPVWMLGVNIDETSRAHVALQAFTRDSSPLYNEIDSSYFPTHEECFGF